MPWKNQTRPVHGLRSADKVPMKCIKIGIVGTGRMGESHAERISKRIAGATISAVASRSIENAEKFAKKYGAGSFCDNPQDMMKSGIDALVIASDGASHEPYVNECIKAGQPVFCEKPLSDTLEGCERIMRAESEIGKRLIQVGFMRRFDIFHREIRQMIKVKVLGEPLMLHAVHRNPLNSGFNDRMEIADAAIHELDILPWILGDDKFVSCVSFSGKRSSLAPKSLADPRILILETETGVIAELEVFTNCSYGFDIKCEVVCEKGTASLPQSSSISVSTAGLRREKEYEIWSTRYGAALDKELLHFMEGVRSGNITGPSAWDAYVAAEVSEVCIRAHETEAKQKISYVEKPSIY